MLWAPQVVHLIMAHILDKNDANSMPHFLDTLRRLPTDPRFNKKVVGKHITRLFKIRWWMSLFHISETHFLASSFIYSSLYSCPPFSTVIKHPCGSLIQWNSIRRMGAILTIHTAQSDGVFHCPISVLSQPGCCRPHREQSERRKGRCRGCRRGRQGTSWWRGSRGGRRRRRARTTRTRLWWTARRQSEFKFHNFLEVKVKGEYYWTFRLM